MDHKVHAKTLPEPVDLSHHYSKFTKNRAVSSVKDFYKYFKIPGISNLAGGLPNNNYFPFDTLEGAAALPHRFVPTPNHAVDAPTQASQISKPSEDLTPSHVVVPKTSDNQDILRKIDLKTALQYSTTQGYPPLYSFLRQFTTETLHPNVPYAGGPEIILTCGNTDGFAKTIEALTNTWNDERDWIGYREGILVEEFCYMNAVQAAKPRGLNIVPVAIDDEGMKADGKGGLYDVLNNWDESQGKRPHLIYTVTIGHNPTGANLSIQRRKEIYEVCVKFDIVIIEDDPYWYLQYPSANGFSHVNSSTSEAQNTETDPSGLESPKSSGYAFLDSLVPSYLSVDYQGRVIRLDTFSKTVAPGCRMGWITAQPSLCERILRITETSTQNPSGFVQSLIAELIMGPHDPKHGRGGGKKDIGWQTDGWVRWLEGLRGNYERRMNLTCDILDEGKYLVKSGRRKQTNPTTRVVSHEDDDWNVITKTPLYDFLRPRGGMFIWLHFRLDNHPLYPQYHTNPQKLARALWVNLTRPAFRVLVAPGEIFAPTEDIRQHRAWAYQRMCFAAVDDGELEGCAKRFVAGVRDFWAKKEIGDVEALVQEGEGRGLEEEGVVGFADLRGWC